MVASNDKYMTSAVESVYLSNEDMVVRKVAREREEYLRHEAYTKRRLEELENKVAEKDASLTELSALLQKYKDKYGDI